ncbi:two-component system CheB/CheR fusion protein [Thioalkalivibrio sp. ALE21]|uniref:CheR family methyltransferase n=1 Tax=Thioalkalivibrio sp. ALE21 TaxID=1158175 RepID=UPI000D96608B|nr:CheR family methyltransferase [Thioalkalivibrio sp. ALE21]PYG03483.1 two-component system CheB/CheR fusion protein [Thioalkalivibrio sp. ALE21]
MPPPSDDPTVQALPIVGVGGSAGSLQPLQSLLAHLPADTGAAYVIVTHHPRGERSLLPEILGPHTALPVQMVEEGEALAPDRVYVALPDDGWVLVRGQLMRSRDPLERPGNGPPHPIDTLFRSLAEGAAHRAIAIVLSGTGSDGTLGVQAIKSREGMVMAHATDTAEFGDMPGNAIATGQVDYVLPAADMPATLTGYLRSRGDRQKALADHAPLIPQNLLARILNQVRQRTGHDFSGYKTSTLHRRLERRMDLRQIVDAEEYLTYLQTHPEEIDLLFQEFLISVTNFFRDPPVWTTLAEKLLPAMLQRAARTGQEFRAWVVGCATGEEAYTLAILVRECIEHWEQAPEVRIFATDVDQAAINIARAGRYPAGIAQDLTEARVRRHFSAENDAYRIGREVRDMVVFAEHNALQDPPFTGLDLITCRNLLIYLERDRQERLLALFRYSLRSQGLLLLGASESPDYHSEAFSVADKESRIFRVPEGGLPSLLPEMPGPSRHHRALPSQESSDSPATGTGNSLARNVERLLALQFAPPTVVVNDRGEVVYIHGRTGRFLEPASGPARNQILEMARPGLRAPLSQALKDVTGSDTDHVTREVQVQTNGDTEPVRLEVRRIRTPAALSGFRLVALHSVPAVDPAEASIESCATAAAPEGGNTADATRLKRELEALRQDKQFAVKELQSSNEELQSLNEELQSMNEEHQSSNEELEAAKEEVESLNQELRSVNTELQTRVDDLTEANDDLKNLLESTHLAILFLDESLNIKRFTMPAQTLIAVRPSDIGRPLRELTTRLCYDSLEADAEAVLDSLIPREVKVQTQTGHWYLLRIQPYRSTRNVIRGVVCTFQDIQAAQGVARPEAFFRAVVDTVREPLLVLNSELRVVSANDGFYRSFPLTPESVEGRSLFKLADGQWNHPELRALLTEVLPQNKAFHDFELTADFGDPESTGLLLNGRRLELEDDASMILLTMEFRRPVSRAPEPAARSPDHGP